VRADTSSLDDSPLDDDGPVPMTAGERAVWAYLVAVVVTSGTYLAVMVPRVLTHPVERISWVGPMLWAIGLSVSITVLVTVVLAVVDSIRTAAAGAACGAGTDSSTGDVAADVRDREIGQLGGRASTGVVGAGLGVVLVLAMIEAPTFWIGNAVFVCGTVGALVETTAKIRLYRRGF